MSRLARTLRDTLGARIADRARSERRSRGQRGSFMMEAVVLMGAIMVVAAGHIALNKTVYEVQRQAQAVDISAQAARGLLEKFDATGWDQVGMWTSDFTGTTYDGDGDGAADPVVRISGTRPASNWQTGPSQPYIETIAGATVTMIVYVTWAGDCAGATCTLATPPGTYGRKRITVETTWDPLGASPPRSRTYRFERNSLVREAPPITLPAS